MEAAGARAAETALRRLLPLLVAMHVVAYADRVNITFAETELQHDLGISASVFGLAAGIFFVGYVFLEVPSNLVLHRVGARVWMARIMVTWGLIAAAGALVWDGTSLVVQRLLLGVAEAGFFPGVVFLLACWFPGAYRGRAMATFMLGIVLATVLGGPISGGLMELDGVLGLHGWQWLFVVEGLPAVLLGLYVLRALPDRPGDARWLSVEEAAALEAAVTAEEAEREPLELRAALRDRRVRRLATVYCAHNCAAYGAIFFAADLIERIGGLSNIEVGLIAAIPFTLGATGLIVLGRRADRTADRRGTLVLGQALGVAGLALTALLPPVLAVGGMALATFGLLGAIPAFWGIPQGMLSGRAAAGGIALINCIGVTGGLIGPVVMGVLKDATGSLTAGTLALAAILAAGATLAARSRSVGGVAAPAPAAVS